MSPKTEELMNHIDQVYTDHLNSLRNRKHELYTEDDRIREVVAVEVLRLIETIRRYEES